MRTKFIEHKPEKYIHMVRNVDTGSVTSIASIINSIPAGTPVILNLGATAEPSTYQNSLPAGFEDGLQVVLPASAASGGQGLGAFALNNLHYGVAISNILYNQLGENLWCMGFILMRYLYVLRELRLLTHGLPVPVIVVGSIFLLIHLIMLIPLMVVQQLLRVTLLCQHLYQYQCTCWIVLQV